MSVLNQTPAHDPDSVSAYDWVQAFVAKHPDAEPFAPALAFWFLNALRSGYRSGAAHGPLPDM